MAVSVSDRQSAAFDEPAHIASGLFSLRENDHRFQPENGLLPQLWVAIPLSFSRDLSLPAPEDGGWAVADVWLHGDTLLHHRDNDTQAVLARARAMNAAAGGILVLVAVLWAWSLCGPSGGVTTGILAAFSPTLLAHAGFATSDIFGALGFVLATLAYWRLLHRVTVPRVLAAGAAVAFFALSKYSVVFFPVVAAVLLIARVCRPAHLPCAKRRIRGLARIAPLALGSLAAAIVAVSLIWAAYGFRYEAAGPHAPKDAGFSRDWDYVLLSKPLPVTIDMADGTVPPGHSLTLTAGVRQHVIAWMRDHRVLPEAWIYGLAFVERNSHFRLAYFAGEWRISGWAAFFPVAYLVKSTPAEIAFHAAGLACVLAAWRSPRRRRQAYRFLPLLVAGAIYGAVAVTSSLNIGHRHLLPLYAFGAILSAAWAARVPDRRRPRLVVIAAGLLLVGHVLASFAQRPHYLAYFNLLAGGPDKGYRFFTDSSLDWGQDLPALRDWLAAHPRPGPLYLSYFGSGEPNNYGIHARRLADNYFNRGDRSVEPELEPGRYMISATMWCRAYTHVRGPWNDSYEQAYRRLKDWLPVLAAQIAKKQPFADYQGRPLTPEDAIRELRRFDHLRFGRLVHQLESMPPTARVAHNWFVYDLDAADLRFALDGPWR